MNSKAGTALAISVLALLTYFIFPGHTYLVQDTQIYVPILEHLWDPSALARDILVEHPHVAFTIYDEVAIALRHLTGAGFHGVLAGQQILFRGLGLWGIYLIAVAVLADQRLALLSTAIWALGAEVPGPAVLVMEYEPSPRAFAIPLLFLAVGLVAHRRYAWAGVAASVGFLYHAPSVLPFWIVYLAVARWLSQREVWRGLWPLLGALALLTIAARFQAGQHEQQILFSRVAPETEFLLRLRTPYDWVSLWWGEQWKQYTLAGAVCFGGLWRMRGRISQELAAWLVALPVIGLLSVPLSYITLDRMKLSIIPQLQPARALLFVVALASLAAVMAGCLAARKRRWLEAGAWFLFPFATAMHVRIDSLPATVVAATGVILAVLACAGSFLRWATPVAALVAFFAIPFLSQVRNYRPVNNPELTAVSAWARAATHRDAVFLFPAPPKNLEPGVFRSQALRAIYVDWKGGGQVNYLPLLGNEWWERYQRTIASPFALADLPRYRALGIDYVVSAKRLKTLPVFENARYAVYACGAHR